MTEEKTNKNMKPCTTCKENVAASAKLCPHCGAKDPTITVKDQIITVIFILFIIVSVSRCVSQPEEEKAVPNNKAVSNNIKTSKLKPVSDTVEEKPLASIDELQAAYEEAQQRAVFIQAIWILVEPEIAVPNQTQITQYLLDGKQKSHDFFYVLALQKPPNTDKDLVALFDQMNRALTFSARAIEKRIGYAIELSSGTKKPVKMAEKFSEEKRFYELNMATFKISAQAIAKELKDRDPKFNKKEKDEIDNLPEEILDNETFIDPIDPNNLHIGQVYIVSKKTPIMQSYSIPGNDLGLEWLKSVRYLMPDDTFTAIEIYDKDRTPWYEVKAVDAQTGKILKGWINSKALYGLRIE